jgi:hypothetical protein
MPFDATTVATVNQVSDGQLTATDQVTLFALRRSTPVGPAARCGSTARRWSSARSPRPTRAYQYPNTDTPHQSARHPDRVQGSAFSGDPRAAARPGESVPLTVRSPTAPGHQSADVVGLPAPAITAAAHLLAHGYGGSAPGSGPTLAAEPVF